MHLEFFEGGNKKEDLEGYDWDQSQLTVLLETGKYNCASSSLLYVILARHFGFRVLGVSLPSHVFVQLESPAGKIIEVETTSKTGYDWIHDKKFYKKKAGDWFKKRALRSSTFKQYQQRIFFEPYQFIADNMTHQHTEVKRMQALDKYRLLEATGYTFLEDSISQIARLAVYNEEFKHLKKKKDFPALSRMYTAIGPVISTIEELYIKNPDIMNLMAWMEYEYAFAMFKVNNETGAFEHVDSSLALTRFEHEDNKAVKENNLALINNHIVELSKREEYEKAEHIVDKYLPLCRQFPWCMAGMEWFYQTWASYYWNEGEWLKAIEKYHKEHELTSKSSEKSRIMTNISNAFYNWSIEYQNEGDWQKSREVLKKCMEMFPNIKKCREELEKLESQHKL
jgi:tetratricopeptide (TPR) repeat protein